MIQKFRLAFSVLSIILFSSIFSYAQSADFYAIDTIQDIKIEFESDGWRMALDSLRFNGNELLLADININGTSLEGVGVRIKQERFFMPDQKKNSLFIRLDHTNAEQRYKGQRAIMLSLSLRDPSMVREVLGLEIARKYMPAPKANYAQVTINKDYYGLFVNLEPIDDTFLENNFGSTEGDLFYSNPPSKNKMRDGCQPAAYGNLIKDNGESCYDKSFDLARGNSFESLMDLAEALNESNDNLSDQLNIDQSLWMLAFHNVTANLSSYIGKEAPNYFLYQTENGQFTPILWNLNFAFGSFKNVGKGSDLSLGNMEKLDPFLHEKNDRKPLVKQLLANRTYKRMYLSHMRTILYEEFLSGNFEKRAKELQEFIKVPLINDRNRYYSSADFEKSLVATIGKVTKIPGLVSFMNNRARFLKKHPDFLIIPPEVTGIKLKERKRYSREKIEDYHIQASASAFTSSVTIYYRFGEDGPFQRTAMVDDGEHFDEGADDKIYGIIIKPAPGSEKIQFYIRAENARSLSYYPTRYMYEREEVKLADLN